MTEKELRRWLYEEGLPDQWVLAIDEEPREGVFTITQAVMRLGGRHGKLLHVSECKTSPPPWIDLAPPVKVSDKEKARKKKQRKIAYLVGLLAIITAGILLSAMLSRPQSKEVATGSLLKNEKQLRSIPPLEVFGIQIGMDRSQFAELVKSSEKVSKDSGSLYTDTVWLKPKFGMSAEVLAKTEHGDSYTWESASVTFANERIVEVTLYSPMVNASRIDAETKPWLAAIKKVLGQKYGPATEDRGFPDFFRLRDGFVVYSSKWLFNGQSIRTGVFDTESQYSGCVEYIDTNYEKIKKDAQEKVTGNL